MEGEGEGEGRECKVGWHREEAIREAGGKLKWKASGRESWSGERGEGGGEECGENCERGRDE